MKKLITMIGVAGMVCLSPGCRKNVAQPEVPTTNGTSRVQSERTTANARPGQQDTATLYVLLDSKPCTTPQSQYTSASIDIRRIQVFNADYGWEDLTPVPGAWDVVSIQSAPVPIAEITENSTVHAGRITKIALTFGDNNQLVVNDVGASCYKISGNRVTLDLDEEITTGTLNEIVVSIDICGNINVEPRTGQDPCYVLKPQFAFESFTVQ
jgi:hypothetical protein